MDEIFVWKVLKPGIFETNIFQNDFHTKLELIFEPNIFMFQIFVYIRFSWKVS